VHPAVEFKLIDTTEQLTAFVPAWRELWQSDPQATPFQSPEWLMPWWRQFGNKNLCCVAIDHGGKAIGFLPFYVYEDSAKRQRQLLPLGIGTTDYLDGVFAPECSAKAISFAALAAMICSACRNCRRTRDCWRR
jgi:CelD/BcsL family acetyltransferase involved in cellulose biosynthesis